MTANRYNARGVSTDKEDVHTVVSKLSSGICAGAFCKITEDYLTGDPDKCNITHADGSGTKSIVAYLHYKETGDASVFRGIAQDSIVMNLDDLLCVGATGPILISNTINRNAGNCPGEVIDALINGSEDFLQTMRNRGVYINSGGGETADVGDLTGTVIVDSCATAIMNRCDVITGTDIIPGLVIVGFSSTGQSVYEKVKNSGIGSNGLTSARHDLLLHMYARRYPESVDPNMPKELSYCGPYSLPDRLPPPNRLHPSSFTVGEALLSPTRTYAPIIRAILLNDREAVKGMVHCSGGGQTKCKNFGRGVHYVKDNLFPVPPVFAEIQRVSGVSWEEMYQVFNMGHRMEIYCTEDRADNMIDISRRLGVSAKVIGHIEPSPDEINHLTITHDGTTIQYHA